MGRLDGLGAAGRRAPVEGEGVDDAGEDCPADLGAQVDGKLAPVHAGIRDLADQGIGILLTDHDVREVLKIADRAYLIINGKVVAHGTPDELKRNQVAIDGYLGSTFEDEMAYPRVSPRRPTAQAAARSLPVMMIGLTPSPARAGRRSAPSAAGGRASTQVWPVA